MILYQPVFLYSGRRRSRCITVLLDVLVHDNGCGNTDVEALDAAILRNFQRLYFVKIFDAKTQTKFLIAENKGAFCWQLNLRKHLTGVGLQGKQGIIALGQSSKQL